MRTASAVIAILINGIAWAGELGLGIGYAGTYTDNVNRSEGGSTDEWIHSYIGGFGYRENSADLAARIQAQVEHRDYEHKSYEHETVGSMEAAAVWTISPQRLIWTFEDRFEQVPQDATQVDTPNNREAVNVANTGPDLLFPVTPVDTLVVGARVGHSYFRESNFDHMRYSGIARWRHLTGPSEIYSLNFEALSAKFTEMEGSQSGSTVADYFRSDLYLRYDRRTPLSRFVLDAGATQIGPDNEEEGYSGPLVRLNLATRLSSDSSIGVSGGMEYLDVSTALLAGLADPTVQETIAAPPPVPQTITSGDVYYQKRADVFYTLASTYSGFRLGAFYRERDYEHVNQDQYAWGGRSDASYNFSSTLTAGIYGEATRTEFLEFVRTDREVIYGAMLAYRLQPELTVRVEGRRTERLSSVSLGGYEETRGVVSILYSTSPVFALAGRR